MLGKTVSLLPQGALEPIQDCHRPSKLVLPDPVDLPTFALKALDLAATWRNKALESSSGKGLYADAVESMGSGRQEDYSS